jgi:hypothetical protein
MDTQARGRTIGGAAFFRCPESPPAAPVNRRGPAAVERLQHPLPGPPHPAPRVRHSPGTEDPPALRAAKSPGCGGRPF